eukprot:TRINITY_DN742_c0_g1_i2.p1 TRINITY_DN742_c0_g1~~TRINITY_DN742_c0_g1_i2.p1  ORF type:complete len:230 (-),score=17.94 TRINITY_DN742_c0_g1_i2:126-728(-)
MFRREGDMGTKTTADNHRYTFTVTEMKYNEDLKGYNTSSDSYVSQRISYLSANEIAVENAVELQIYVATDGRAAGISLVNFLLTCVLFSTGVKVFSGIVEFVMLYERHCDCCGKQITLRFFRLAELYYRTKYDKTPNLTQLAQVRDQQSELETLLGAAEELGGIAVTRLRKEMTAVEWNVEELRASAVSCAIQSRMLLIT